VAYFTKPASTTGPPPQPGAETWPMPVEHFLAGKYLKRADVVLTRKHRDWRSWLIRWATRGKFSHAALVFLVPYDEVGYDNTFVIEAATEGVDLTNLADYLNDRRTIVGFKRLDKPWFDWEVQSLVRGCTLNSIKSKYSYQTLFRLAWRTLDHIVYGVQSRVRGEEKAIAGRNRRSRMVPNEFICSGLVQMGYITVVNSLIQKGRLEPAAIADVIFEHDLAPVIDKTDWTKHAPAEQLRIAAELVEGFSDVFLAETPEDLAITPKLAWVYIVRDGLVHPVLSDADAQKLLDWEPGE
jgi:hypothetical protein